jgi:hypothetical protein
MRTVGRLEHCLGSYPVPATTMTATNAAASPINPSSTIASLLTPVARAAEPCFGAMTLPAMKCFEGCDRTAPPGEGAHPGGAALERERA